MQLSHLPSGNSLKAAITELVEKDFLQLKSSEDFGFDWSEESDYEVYKIFLINKSEEILGVTSLKDIPGEYRIHLNLIEVSKKHQGKTKEIDRIAGCLIAFSVAAAFKRGYDGFVSLEPKTRLIDLYQDKYSFRQYGRYLGIEGDNAINLVNQYFEDEEE